MPYHTMPYHVGCTVLACATLKTGKEVGAVSIWDGRVRFRGVLTDTPALKHRGPLPTRRHGRHQRRVRL